MTPGMPNPNDPIQCPNVFVFKCPDCLEELHVQIHRPMIANAATLAIIAFTHETPDVCHKCGAKFLMKIVGINQQFQLQIAWVKLQTHTSHLVPGNDQEMKNALQRMDTITEITGR